MVDFGINEMLEMQKTLQEQYKDKWSPICPERGKDQLLWMIGEIGEVIDIIKKHGCEKASGEAELREHLIEELADVLMYYNDVLLCYGISSDELKRSYVRKYEKNMKRWQIPSVGIKARIIPALFHIKETSFVCRGSRGFLLYRHI